MYTVTWGSASMVTIRLAPGVRITHDGWVIKNGTVQPGNFKPTFDMFAKILKEGLYKPQIL